MAKTLARLLIIHHQRDFACRVGGIAERLGIATRILQHTLDFEYVMLHWPPAIVVLGMPMPYRQDIEVMGYLKQCNFPGHLLLIGDANEHDLDRVVIEAQSHGLIAAAALTKYSPSEEIERALRPLLNLEHAA